MVAIIEGKEEAGGARYIEFKVCRSPTDPDQAVASWSFAVDQSKPGTSIEMELRHVLDCADQHGIAFVWVNDPDELLLPLLRR